MHAKQELKRREKEKVRVVDHITRDGASPRLPTDLHSVQNNNQILYPSLQRNTLFGHLPRGGQRSGSAALDTKSLRGLSHNCCISIQEQPFGKTLLTDA